MKIAVFKYNASIAKWKENGGGECINTELIESEINEFMEDKTVIDIKTNTYTYDRHNNGGADGVMMVYTILYK